MIPIEELAGVVEVLGVTNEDELYAIFKELTFFRRCKVPSRKNVKELIGHAIKEHWIEAVNGSGIIVGPCAFTEVPDDLSEVIDILKIDINRKIDWNKVSSVKTGELKSDFEDLSKKIYGLKGKITSKKQIIELENDYNRLMQLYYDFDFWLPVNLALAKEELRSLSKELESLRT
ncbi:MAG: hypothetical protein GKB99_02155 [Methanocellales archaeon]|nr:hypothetical protein [Methanocellales archaeon]